MTFDHSALHLHTDSGHLRIALRAYFTIIFLILAFFGNQCCKKLVRLLVLKKKDVNLTLTTGWLSRSVALMTAFSQRRLPSGWMGILMILAGSLAMLSDFVVSGFVRTVSIPARCAFTTGVVLPLNPVGYRSNSSNQQMAYKIATQAQATSQQNGGLIGIYWKANSDPNFRASNEDVVGQWNCSDAHHDAEFPVDTPAQTIGANLLQSSLIYNYSSACNNHYPDGSISDLLIWSASVGDYTNSTWDVRVAMDMHTLGPHPPILMKSLECSMNASSADWVLRSINSKATPTMVCWSLWRSWTAGQPHQRSRIHPELYDNGWLRRWG